MLTAYQMCTGCVSDAYRMRIGCVQYAYHMRSSCVPDAYQISTMCVPDASKHLLRMVHIINSPCLSRRDVSATCQHQRGNHKSQLYLLAESRKCSTIPAQGQRLFLFEQERRVSSNVSATKWQPPCTGTLTYIFVTESYFYWIYEASAQIWRCSLPASINSSSSLACKAKTPSYALHSLAVLMYQ